jgi:hypothetical protein
MFRSLLLLLLFTFSCTAAPNFLPLFNGEDLSGFKVPKNNIWWSVEDELIVCKSGPKKKGSTLWSQKKFENFTVELDFKMVSGTVDSGLFLRNNDQIQIGISGSLKRDMTSSPYIPKKGYPKESEGVADILKVEGWNTLKVKADGRLYTIWLNGKQVNHYQSSTAIEKGPVGLQLHAGKDMEIRFKNFRIAEI